MKRVIIWIFVVLVIVVGGAVGALFYFDQQARDDDEVLVVELPFITPGSSAVTAGRIIFVRSDRADDPELLAHELVHVCQWEEQGLEFLWEYTNTTLNHLTGSN
ncbi:MAG: DUF4157 domain-containing protein [Actinomycetota bacterium]|nr:DUF4157 domain-containing protein [Actinomycetota bacterium]